jgi:hypothetical protein
MNLARPLSDFEKDSGGKELGRRMRWNWKPRRNHVVYDIGSLNIAMRAFVYSTILTSLFGCRDDHIYGTYESTTKQ